MIPDVIRFLIALLLLSAPLFGHEAERTRVTLTLSADGSFTLDVANDPMWLLLRLETFAGGAAPANMTPTERDMRLTQLTTVFADRIVLFVDSHEVRATRVEYVAPARDQGSGIRGVRSPGFI